MTSESVSEGRASGGGRGGGSQAGWPGGGWTSTLRERLQPADTRQLLFLGALLALSVLLRLVTWNDIADGARGAYVKTTLFGALAAVVVWGLVRMQTGAGSWVPLLSAAAVLIAGDAIHYLRLANPISHGGPVQHFEAALSDPAGARRQWYVEEGGDGKVLFAPNALVLQTPASSSAFVVAQLDGTPDAGTSWWLPVALAREEPREELTWRASVQRSGDYLVVTELRNLLIQAVGYGLHVTYPDERGAPKGHEVPHPTVLDGRPHDWKITRDSREIVLLVDGTRIWAAPQRGPLRELKLGETKIDPQHGGTIRIERAGYASYLERR
jgi:hypothetical protein